MEKKASKTNKITSRDLQAAETKEKLMKAAVGLFLEQGYEATSVRAINRKAGVADGLLYHYFSGGKKELFHDVIENHVRSVINDISTAGLIAKYEEMPLEDALEKHFTIVLDTIEKHIDIFRMICKEAQLREIITEKDIEHMLSHPAFQFTEILCKKIESGELKDIDVMVAGQSVAAMIISYVFCRVLDLPGHILLNSQSRKNIIDYYVKCWKK